MMRISVFKVLSDMHEVISTLVDRYELFLILSRPNLVHPKFIYRFQIDGFKLLFLGDRCPNSRLQPFDSFKAFVEINLAIIVYELHFASFEIFGQ